MPLTWGIFARNNTAMRDKDGFRWIDPNDLYMVLFLVVMLLLGRFA